MSLAPESGSSALARLGRGEIVGALALLALCLAVFFEKPLRLIRDHQYTTADVTQDYSLTRIDPTYTPANRITSDPAVQMQPWVLFNREELAQGRFPLWNPFNGTGAPHFANFQSAVLSPFSLPFYVLPLRWALIVSAVAKLAVLAIFTWLFLRRLGLEFWPASIGAAAFTWSGHNVLLLGYPHVAALVALPAGLYFADRVCTELEQRSRRAVVSVAGLVLSLTVGLLGGHPEPFYFCAVGVALWSAFRLFEGWRAGGRGWAGVRAIGVRAVALLASAGLAAGLAAIQLLPFFEYLGQSTALVVRDRPQTPLTGHVWPFLVFPNVLGSPTKHENGWPSGPLPNYEVVNSVTTSALFLVLVVVSFLWLRRSRAHAFFALVLTWWVVYAYNVLGLAHVVAPALPGLYIAPINRSQPIGIFAGSVCLAFAVQQLGATRGRARWLACIAIPVVAASIVWPAHAVTLERFARYLARNSVPQAFIDATRSHVRLMLVLVAAGAGVAMLLPWLGATRLRHALGAALFALCFVPWGWMMRNYNPTVPDAFVFPRTEATARLRQLVGDERLLIFGEDTLPPDTNMRYGVRLPTNYDALLVRHYDELWRAHFGDGDNWRPAQFGTLAGLKLLGIRKLLTKGPWLPIETMFAGVRWNSAFLFRPGAIAPGNEISQTFTASADGMQAVMVELATDARANRCTLWFALEDIESHTVIDLQSTDASSLREDEFGRCPVVFRFDPVRDSKGHRYRLTLSSPDATPSQCLVARGSRVFGKFEEAVLVKGDHPPLKEYIPGELAVAGQRQDGGLIFDVSYNREMFRRVTEFAGFTLWNYEDGTEPFQLVDRARGVASLLEAKRTCSRADFDAAREVVLLEGDVRERTNPVSRPYESAIVVEESASDRTRMYVRRSAPGWLVAAQPFYPGWKAFVNGVPVPILRANYAFCAIEVPEGSSSVELRYEPRSFRRGAWVSALALAGVLVLLGWVRLRTAR